MADIQKVGKFIELISTKEILLNDKSMSSLSIIPLQIQRKKMLNRHITIEKSDRKLSRCLRRRHLVAASDGSAHTGRKASFAYCFADSVSEKLLYASHGPTLVDPEYANSDRSELLGILGAVTKLHEIENGMQKKRNKKKSPAVTLYTDSSSSISVLQNKFRPSTKNVMKSNMDVILEIQEEQKKLKSFLRLVHVKAHQDDGMKYEDLPLPARLNVDMDKLAELQYKKPIQEHYTKMTHLPAQAISFSTPWYRITNNLEK